MPMLTSDVRELYETPKIFFYKQTLVKALPWVKEIFYVSSNGAYFDGTEIKGRTVIYQMESSMPQISPDQPGIDGPYLSKEHIVLDSPIYNLIIANNPQISAQILLRKLKRMDSFSYATYFTVDFISNLPYILEHTFNGNQKSEKLTGVHFHTSEVNFKKFIPVKGGDKIPLYQIEKQEYNSKVVVPKKNASTFWPFDWKIEDFVFECAYAWCNKIKVGQNYEGVTRDGIIAVFCFDRKGKFKTVYPKCN